MNHHNHSQRKKGNTALSEGSLEPRSSLDNATDREKGTKDVDNHADIHSPLVYSVCSVYSLRTKAFRKIVLRNSILAEWTCEVL